MRDWKRLLLAISAMVLLGVVTSTGGFSSIVADRAVEIAIADDENAFLGFQQTPFETTNGTTDLSVTVANQFPSDTTLTSVKVNIGDQTINLAANDPLGPGEGDTITFESVSCGAPIMINASGSTVQVQLNRTVKC